MVCNWFGHILSLARPARGESSIAHRAPRSTPLRLSHLLSPHGCTGQLAELLQGRRVKPLKGNYFIDTIRDDILFDILLTSPSPSPLTNIQPPSCIPTAPRGALDLCECVQAGWCILVQSFFACFYSSNRIHWIFFFYWKAWYSDLILIIIWTSQ